MRKGDKTSDARTKNVSDSTERMARIMGVEFRSKDGWKDASSKTSSTLKRASA